MWRRDTVILAAGLSVGALAVLAAVLWQGAPPPLPAPPAEAPAAAPPPQAPSARRETRPDAPAPQRAPSPWQRFAVAAPASGGRPIVAIVIDDLGIDRARTAQAIALPAPLTLSFLTYARELEGQVRLARAAGHEIMAHVPMAPDNGAADPGPHALRPGLDAAELQREIDWHLGRLDSYVGINNHMGSRFMADDGAVRVVLRELKRRGLMFLDSRTGPRTAAAPIAKRLALPFAERDVFLDDEPGAAAVAEALVAVERKARQQGYAIAIGHPKDATLAALAGWIAGARQAGLVPVPVSAVVRHRLSIGQVTAEPGVR